MTWSVPYGSQGLDGIDIWGLEFPENDGRGIAFGNRGSIETLYQTLDGGATWSPLMQLSATSSHIQPVTQFIDSEVGMAVTSNGPLLRTVDGGHTWQQLPPNPVYNNSGLAMIDRLTVIMCNDTSIYRSGDGGNSWNRVVSVSFGGTHHAPRIVSARNNVVLVPAVDSWMHRSIDGGLSWSAVSWPGSSPVSMAWASDATVFVLTDQGALYRSDDAGLGWRQVLPNADVESFSAIKFSADGRLGIMVGTNVIYRTSDGGATWNRDLMRTGGWWSTVGFAGSRAPVVAGMEGAVVLGSGY
jgi:photosystem II stability/assembly factor-like uncharacterized protein